jgi:hypothetical protein
MAVTKMSDIIVPEVMASMASAEISNFLDFEKTGLVTSDYNNVNITQGGNFVDVPFYNQIAGSDADEVLSDSTSLTPGKITTGKDIGVVCHRGKAWGSRDLAKIVNVGKSDPQKEIARQVGKYWAQRIRTALIAVLNGNFATSGPLAANATHPHLYNVATTSVAPVLFSHTAAIKTMQLLGDAMNDFDVIIMHSKIYGDLVAAKLTSWSLGFNPGNTTLDSTSDTYLGKKIIVSDDVPVNTGTASYYIYTTYFAKKGCMYLGRQQDLMTETDRDILAFEDVLSTSVHFVPHIKLIKWNTTDTNPTNTLLATVTQWTSVANDHKFIGLAALTSN